jgi:hypothetical protein
MLPETSVRDCGLAEKPAREGGVHNLKMEVVAGPVVAARGPAGVRVVRPEARRWARKHGHRNIWQIRNSREQKSTPG